MTLQFSQPIAFVVIEINEHNVARITGTLLDEAGDPVPLVALNTVTLTLYDKASDTIINLRDGQDIKNNNGGTIEATSGAFTLLLGSADNVIVNTALVAPQIETHVALIRATWGSGGYWSGIAQVRVRQVHRVTVASP